MYMYMYMYMYIYTIHKITRLNYQEDNRRVSDKCKSGAQLPLIPTTIVETQTHNHKLYMYIKCIYIHTQVVCLILYRTKVWQVLNLVNHAVLRL